MLPKFLAPLLYIGMVQANTTKECQDQLHEFQLGIETNQRWSLQIMDATGKGPAGIFSGNLANLGTFDQCLATTTNTPHGIIRGKYCLGSVGVTFKVLEENGTYMNISKYIDWGVCIPERCTVNDIAAVNPSALLRHLNAINITSRFDEVFCQTLSSVGLRFSANQTIPNKDLFAHSLTTVYLPVKRAIVCTLLGLVISSTAYEYYNTHWNKQSAIGILATFSVIKNGKQLAFSSANKDQIPCLNGLRVISLLWILLYHEYTVYEGSLINLEARDAWLNSFSNFYVKGGTYAVDTFFVMGGLLVGYNYQKSADLNKPFRLSNFYMHRILRIVPSVAFLLMLYTTLVGYLGSGPYWPKVYKQRDICKRYWWSTLLFVQNYVNVWNMCLGPTWYLNVDMQLYVLSPIILLMSKFRREVAVGLTVLLILASTATSLALFYIHESYDHYYYYSTHTRAPCWLIGLVLGLELDRFRTSKYKYSTLQVFSMWTTSLTILFSCCTFLRTYRNWDGYQKYISYFLVVTARPAWAVGVCCVIIACVTGVGGPVNAILSLPVFQILSKLTYNMYLIHTTLMWVIVCQTDTPYEFSQLTITKGVWGDCVFSMVWALLMVLVVEYPIQSLEKILMK